MLHVRRYGRNGAGPLVALHGFTLTGAMFEPLSRHLDVELLAPDLPGHGRSPAATTLDDAVAAVADTLERSIAPPGLLGYSMGGRLALRVALVAPDHVHRLVVVSAGTGIPDAAERRRRRAADEAMARRMNDLSIDDFLDEWLSNPLVGHDEASSAEATRSDLELRRENDTKRLAGALQAFGQAAATDVAGRLGELEMPVLLISGGRDQHYGSRMAEMARRIPTAEHAVIASAGHNVVFDAPEELADVVEDWLLRPGESNLGSR